MIKHKLLAIAATLAMLAMPLASGATNPASYPSGSLVNDGGTIYFISGTTKIPFTNWDAFVGLGYSGKNVITASLAGYSLSGSYMITTANAAHPWGSWLINNGTVYYSSQSGLIGVPSINVFLTDGGNWNLVVKANTYDLSAIAVGQVLTSGDARVQTGFVCPNNAMCAHLVPVINNLSPASGPIGTQVTITGVSFTSTGNTVNFGSGAIQNISSANGTTLTFTVPTGLAPACNTPTTCPNAYMQVLPGNFNISVTNSNGTSNSQTFTVSGGITYPAPVSITSLSPSSGAVGSIITITGSGFTATGNTVNFGAGVTPNLTSQNGTTITFTIPGTQNPACYYTAPQCLPPTVVTSTGQYNISVTNTNGTSNAQTFNVTFTCPNNAMCATPITQNGY